MNTNALAHVLKFLLLVVAITTGATQLIDQFKGMLPEKYAVGILSVSTLVLALSRPIISSLDPDGDGEIGTKPPPPQSPPAAP